MLTGSYPALRLRRGRSSAWVRELLTQHRLHTSDLIWPVFVQEGKHKATPIPSMPGVARLSIDLLVKEAKKARDLGIPAIALFPVVDPKLKTDDAREAFSKNNLIARAIAEVKANVPNLGIICDVALDPYTSHGHDGIVMKGDVANDETIELLCKQAVLLAKAGADIVAPSDMMDGRVGAIRGSLDKAGFTHVMILSYAAKFASAFYGPFRDAVGSTSALKGANKKTYQMNPANGQEAMREIALDIQEGADLVMVKPGMPYLDVIRETSHRFSIPVFAYQVSGEYAMLKLAAEQGLGDYEALLLESLIAFKRAGARAILTYAALDAASLIASLSH